MHLLTSLTCTHTLEIISLIWDRIIFILPKMNAWPNWRCKTKQMNVPNIFQHAKDKK